MFLKTGAILTTLFVAYYYAFYGFTNFAVRSAVLSCRRPVSCPRLPEASALT